MKLPAGRDRVILRSVPHHPTSQRGCQVPGGSVTARANISSPWAGVCRQGLQPPPLLRSLQGEGLQLGSSWPQQPARGAAPQHLWPPASSAPRHNFKREPLAQGQG